MQPSSKEHFNTVADQYDSWKEKNWYYYENIKRLFRSLVRPGSRVLEIGCGTGQVLASLDIKQGHGVDISEEMIEIAKRRYRDRADLSFEALDILKSSTPFDYDYILIPDTIGHIEHLREFTDHISARTKPGTPIIVSTANSLWTPILILSEKLKLKSPEGPHWWLSVGANEKIFKKSGLKIVKRGYHLLIPKKIPGSDWINRHFSKIPFLRALGLGVWWMLER